MLRPSTNTRPANQDDTAKLLITQASAFKKYQDRNMWDRKKFEDRLAGRVFKEVHSCVVTTCDAIIHRDSCDDEREAYEELEKMNLPKDENGDYLLRKYGSAGWRHIDENSQKEALPPEFSPIFDRLQTEGEIIGYGILALK